MLNKNFCFKKLSDCGGEAAIHYLSTNKAAMKSILLIASTLVFFSCGHSPLVSHLQGSDSVAVVFKKPVTEEVIKVVGTAQPYAIQDLLTYTGSKETAQFKCGYDGEIRFYKQGTLAGDVSFNYTTDGCHHFVINKAGKLTATEMSNQAIDFLKALANGKQ